jgi:Fe-S cluster biosynthesis and repair protein YggX
VNGIFAGSLIFPQLGKEEWSNWGLTNIEHITLMDGENSLTIRFDDFNRNMDGKINDFLLDCIYLQRLELQ